MEYFFKVIIMVYYEKPFKDEPLHYPYYFRHERVEDIAERICKYIRQGNRVTVAFQRAGFVKFRYYEWKRFYEEELEAGLTDTPIIRLFHAIESAEAEVEDGIVGVVRSSALDGNMKSAFYLLDNRFNWKKQGDVTVEADDKVVNINILPMKDEHEEE